MEIQVASFQNYESTLSLKQRPLFFDKKLTLQLLLAKPTDDDQKKKIKSSFKKLDDNGDGSITYTTKH